MRYSTSNYFGNACSIAFAIRKLPPAGQAGGPGRQYSGTAGRIPEIFGYVMPYRVLIRDLLLPGLKVSRYASAALISVSALLPTFWLTLAHLLYLYT